jgi:replicative DNA helicase
MSDDTSRIKTGAETNRNGTAMKQLPASDPWEAAVPLDEGRPPSFPVECLPGWLEAWASGIAEATQTPVDLAAMLSLAVASGGIAGKFRVCIRPGWVEPTNLYAVVSLPPGERKSAVFTEAVAPVIWYEQQNAAEMAPMIEAAKSEHRIMEQRLKNIEAKAAKAESKEERDELRHDAKRLAQELAAHVVPESPILLVDDISPEKLGQLIPKHGNKMFQASAEGTAFEIAKGRYSETANFDVYLKAHSGDPLRSDRISRERDAADQPALTVALAVQPDVIQGLTENASMRGRGFLARFLYSIPNSFVGRRLAAPSPVTDAVKAAYRANVLGLWELAGAVEDGKPAAHFLTFTPAAAQEMRAFEVWLEPQLGENESLSHLAGWANKLAGAIARIAGVLHMANSAGQQWRPAINIATVQAAIRIGKEYLLPHALAAFGLMGADSTTEDAKALWASIVRRSADGAHSASAPPRFSRRDALNWNRRRFKTADDLDPALKVLTDHHLIRHVPGTGSPGRGQRSPEFDVNPTAFDAAKKSDLRAHCAQRTHRVLPAPVTDEEVEPAAPEEDVSTPFDEEAA